MNSTSIYFILPVIFSLLAYLFPFKSTLNSFSSNYVVLKFKYQKWETFSVVPLFIFIISFTYGLGKLFLYITEINRKPDGSQYQILPTDWTWFVPAFFLSFGLIIIPMSLLYKFILSKDGYDEYLLFTNLKHGFDGMKIMRPIFVLFTLIGTIGLFLLNDYSVKLYSDKIEINSLFTTKTNTIQYDEIKAIHFVQNKIGTKKETISFPHYVIVFDNDLQWIADNEHDLKSINNEKVINYLREKAKGKIDTLSSYQN